MQVRSTSCDICGHTGCSLKITTEANKITKIAGDKADPRTKGKICSQALAINDILSSNKRLTHPLIKSKNGWNATTWDEALSLIATKLDTIKEKQGPKSIAFATGYARTYARTVNKYINKLAEYIGTPNVTGMEHTCAIPRKLAMSYVIGPMHSWRSADLSNSNCIILWGINPVHDPPRIKSINNAIETGKTVIAIDPRATPFAKKANLHLQPRPGTDGAIALSMINVIINKELHDEDFVSNWTTGFDQLKRLVSNYSPDKVAKTTWLKEDDIIEAATLYATSGPSSIDHGNGLDQHTNNFQTCRAIASLIAVSGNLDICGGNLLQYGPTNIPAYDPGKLRNAVGQERFPLILRAHMPSYWRAILTGNPYKINGMVVYGTNPAVTDCNTKTVKEALEELEFLAVIDLFMTETAKYADIVLPATSFLETNLYLGGEKVVNPPGKAWPDEKIIVELANKMGLKIEQRENIPITSSAPDVKYKRYLEEGFQTSSGKVEFYSKLLKDLGLNPLPVFVEPVASPSSDDLRSMYPLVLTTGAKLPMYTHSQFRNIPRLSRLFPDNMFTVNPVTAEVYGVRDGDEITVESPSGSLSGPVVLSSDLVENVVQVYHGFDTMNANLLIDSRYFDIGTGSPGMKSSLCRIISDK
jgi:anaerobic selenocysteine-containing dehydrogenase